MFIAALFIRGKKWEQSNYLSIGSSQINFHIVIPWEKSQQLFFLNKGPDIKYVSLYRP